MAHDRRRQLKGFTVLSRLWPQSSFTKKLFATFWSHLQTKDRQSQTLHLHWTLKEIKAEQAPRLYRGVYPQPRHTQGPCQLLQGWHCATPHSEELRVPWALQQPCLLCVDTAAAASSPQLTSGCPRWLCMKEQGCTEWKRGPSLFPIHGTVPKCLHPAVAPQAQEGPGDPSSAQTSWAESPAHHAQMNRIHIC